MKKIICGIFVLITVAVFHLPAYAAQLPADGRYTVEVTLSGGSGRAEVASPAEMTVLDGKMTAVIVWSSPNYDFMMVDGVFYYPVNTGGNSTYEIPVSALDEDIAVSAETVAMSTPHVIDYTLHFYSASLISRAHSPASAFTASAMLLIAAAVIGGLALAAYLFTRSRRKGKRDTFK
jgi:hypothetical protein